MVNHHLLKDLTELGIWDDSMKNQLIANNGSVQNIDGIPSELKDLYKTVWEISQRVVLEMAADRGAFIDQSQSLNVHIAAPTYGKITSMHFFGWKAVREDFILFIFIYPLFIYYLLTLLTLILCIYFQGLKTGMYYLRTKPAANAIQFTVDKTKLKKSQEKKVDENNEDSSVKELNEKMAGMVCSLENKDECLMCGS